MRAAARPAQLARRCRAHLLLPASGAGGTAYFHASRRQRAALRAAIYDASRWWRFMRTHSKRRAGLRGWGMLRMCAASRCRIGLCYWDSSVATVLTRNQNLVRSLSTECLVRRAHSTVSAARTLLAEPRPTAWSLSGAASRTPMLPWRFTRLAQAGSGTWCLSLNEGV